MEFKGKTGKGLFGVVGRLRELNGLNIFNTFIAPKILRPGEEDFLCVGSSGSEF